MLPNKLSKLLLLLCVLLVISNLYFVISEHQRRMADFAKIQELQAKITDLESHLIIDRQEFIDLATNLGALMPVYYHYFPNHVVYWNSKEVLIVEPMNPDIPANTLDWNYLSRDAKNRLQFDDGTTKAKVGIDVSVWQGTIDWEAVKADGIDYAIIRVGNRGYTEGKINEDDRALYNLAQASKVKMPIGVYFYSGAINETEAIEEAKFVINIIKDYDITYPVVFDMEENNDPQARDAKLTTEERTKITVAFLDTIKNAGYKPAVYGNMRWLNERLDYKTISQYDVWLAQYYNSPILPYQFTMWQYTSSGRVKGIKGNVDMNLSFKDYTVK